MRESWDIGSSEHDEEGARRSRGWEGGARRPPSRFRPDDTGRNIVPARRRSSDGSLRQHEPNSE
jgi:hypothetical protein